MTDFIREVDEEVRQDRLKRFVRSYWIAFVALAVLVLVGVGAWEATSYIRTNEAEASGGRFLDALDLARDGKTDEAIAALQGVAAEGTEGYRLLARMRLAAVQGVKDKAAGAKAFDAIAAEPGLDPAIRNVALLRAAMLLIDGSTYPDFKRRIEPLADANSPVRNAARELLALAALKADATEEAGRALDAIQSDPTTTGQQRQRADTLQGLVRGAGQGSAAPASAAPVPEAAVPAPSTAPAVPSMVGAPPLAGEAPAILTPAPEAPVVPAAPDIAEPPPPDAEAPAK